MKKLSTRIYRKRKLDDNTIFLHAFSAKKNYTTIRFFLLAFTAKKNYTALPPKKNYTILQQIKKNYTMLEQIKKITRLNNFFVLVPLSRGDGLSHFAVALEPG